MAYYNPKVATPVVARPVVTPTIPGTIPLQPVDISNATLMKAMIGQPVQIPVMPQVIGARAVDISNATLLKSMVRIGAQSPVPPAAAGYDNVYYLPGARRNVLEGLGLTINTPVGKINIDTAAIGNEVINGIWPNVEGKVKAMLPGVIDMAMNRVEAEVPKLLGKVLPMAVTEVQKVLGQYEARYMGMVRSYQKFATPVAVGALAVAVLISAAAVITIRDAQKGKRS
jgi:hypothetical protein